MPGAKGGGEAPFPPRMLFAGWAAITVARHWEGVVQRPLAAGHPSTWKMLPVKQGLSPGLELPKESKPGMGEIRFSHFGAIVPTLVLPLPGKGTFVHLSWAANIFLPAPLAILKDRQTVANSTFQL